MPKGKIIFLCGVTSSGKTSIVDAIQDTAEAFYYVVANDLMVQMVGDRYLRENYWKYESRAIYYMYHMAKLLSDKGENVIIDGCLVETPELPNHYETVKAIFADSPLYLVHVYCPLEVCRERNLSREDRYEMQSQEQHDKWTKDVSYDITVNTHIKLSAECADEILQYVSRSNACHHGHKNGMSTKNSADAIRENLGIGE